MFLELLKTVDVKDLLLKSTDTPASSNIIGDNASLREKSVRRKSPTVTSEKISAIT